MCNSQISGTLYSLFELCCELYVFTVCSIYLAFIWHGICNKSGFYACTLASIHISLRGRRPILVITNQHNSHLALAKIHLTQLLGLGVTFPCKISWIFSPKLGQSSWDIKNSGLDSIIYIISVEFPKIQIKNSGICIQTPDIWVRLWSGWSNHIFVWMSKLTKPELTEPVCLASLFPSDQVII